mmetsp:Transcript_95267/g.269145  ORF Transcript_95267/g.269145 Transcript_95267/m.269145 type:complete len:140 (-) Transcript_95267:85-504(-)
MPRMPRPCLVLGVDTEVTLRLTLFPSSGSSSSAPPEATQCAEGPRHVPEEAEQAVEPQVQDAVCPRRADGAPQLVAKGPQPEAGEEEASDALTQDPPCKDGDETSSESSGCESADETGVSRKHTVGDLVSFFEGRIQTK